MDKFDVTAATPEQFREHLLRMRSELVHFDIPSGRTHALGGRKNNAFGGVFQYKPKKNMRRRYTK